MIRLTLAMVLSVVPLAALAQADDQKKLTEESRKVAVDLVTQVRGELTRELELSGPLKAVLVCKYTVPELTSQVSRRTGWRVTRVSLHPRNPGLAMPDVWEQKVLMEFDRRVAQGEKPETLEYAEVVTEPMGRFFRYMKALPLAPMCMTCHGDKVSEAMKAQLANEYPFDNAVGGQVGSIRGATSVKRPL